MALQPQIRSGAVVSSIVVILTLRVAGERHPQPFLTGSGRVVYAEEASEAIQPTFLSKGRPGFQLGRSFAVYAAFLCFISRFQQIFTTNPNPKPSARRRFPPRHHAFPQTPRGCYAFPQTPRGC